MSEADDKALEVAQRQIDKIAAAHKLKERAEKKAEKEYK